MGSGRISREIPIEVDSNYPTYPDTTPMPQQHNGYYPSHTPDRDNRQRGRRGMLNTPQQQSAPVSNCQPRQTGRRGPRYPTSPQFQQQNSLDLAQEPVEQ